MIKNKIYSLDEITNIVKPIAKKYGVDAVFLFGSYAKGTATDESDIDFIVFGGKDFKLALVYAMGEELREAFQKEIDIFEIHEVNEESDFYHNVMRERTRVA